MAETANRTQKPHVAHALRHAFYVDDFLGGADSLEEAQQLMQDFRDELSNYGFPLRKWSSSDPDLIKNLPAHLRAENDDLKLFAEDYKVKALGIFGNQISINSSSNVHSRRVKSSQNEIYSHPHRNFLTP